MGETVSGTSGEQTPRLCWADLDGPVHYADYGGSGDGPPLLLIHGLGGSLASWAALAPALTRTSRVLAIDLAGFGLTRSSGFSASLPANRDLLHRFLTEVIAEPTVLVGHSMGGTIAVMEASGHPGAVAGLVLISPVVPWVRDELERRLGHVVTAVSQVIKPGDAVGSAGISGPGRQGLSAQRASARQSRVHPPRLSARLLGEYFAVARARGWGHGPRAELIAAGRSLTWTLLHRQQFAAMLFGIQAPVLWLHGERDPLVPIAVARDVVRDKTSWSFVPGPNVGHEPHQEDPGWTTERIEDWLDAIAAATGPDITLR
jgi:pimeloyl-ACP methyl ester carboxylesterase